MAQMVMKQADVSEDDEGGKLSDYGVLEKPASHQLTGLDPQHQYKDDNSQTANCLELPLSENSDSSAIDQPSKSSKRNSMAKKFVDRWLQTYKWLEKGYQRGRIVMFCLWCKSINANNTFTTGCGDLQKSALSRHELIKDHIRAKMMAIEASVAHQKDESHRTMENSKFLLSVLRTINFLDYEGLSSSKLDSFIDLQIMNGAKYLTGFADTHDLSVSGLRHALRGAIIRRRCEQFMKSPFISLILLAEMNFPGQHKLQIFARYIKIRKPFTVFLGSYKLEMFNSQVLLNQIVHMMETNGIDKPKIVGLASNGKAIMTDPAHGVGVNLKEMYSPNLLQMHNVFHAPIDIDASGFLYELQKVIFDVFSLITNSERINTWIQFAGFRGFCPKMASNSLKCSEFLKTIIFFHANWSLFVQVLKRESTATNGKIAAVLLKNLLSYKFVASMHTAMDFLSIIDRFDKTLDVNQFSLVLVKLRVDAIKNSFLELRMNLGPSERIFLNEFSSTGKYCDITLTSADGREVLMYKEARYDFINTLLADISRRFPEADLDVIWALGCIFDVTMHPKDRNELEIYANHALSVIISAFGTSTEKTEAVIDPVQVNQSFREFKCILSSLCCHNFLDACLATIKHLSHGYPDFAVLANIALVLPANRPWFDLDAMECGNWRRKDLADQFGGVSTDDVLSSDTEILLRAACEAYQLQN